MNVSERRLYGLLCNLGIEVRPQAKIGRYTVDFLIPSMMVVVEADSLLYHSHADAARRDRMRDADLQDMGYMTIHVWTHDLLTKRGQRGVWKRILRRLVVERGMRSAGSGQRAARAD